MNDECTCQDHDHESYWDPPYCGECDCEYTGDLEQYVVSISPMQFWAEDDKHAAEQYANAILGGDIWNHMENFMLSVDWVKIPKPNENNEELPDNI